MLLPRSATRLASESCIPVGEAYFKESLVGTRKGQTPAVAAYTRTLFDHIPIPAVVRDIIERKSILGQKGS